MDPTDLHTWFTFVSRFCPILWFMYKYLQIYEIPSPKMTRNHHPKRKTIFTASQMIKFAKQMTSLMAFDRRVYSFIDCLHFY